MSWNVENFTVAFVAQATIPAEVVEQHVLANRDSSVSAGYNKLGAIRQLREWFEYKYGSRLGLKESKEIVEFVGDRMKQEGRL